MPDIAAVLARSWAAIVALWRYGRPRVRRQRNTHADTGGSRCAASERDQMGLLRNGSVTRLVGGVQRPRGGKPGGVGVGRPYRRDAQEVRRFLARRGPRFPRRSPAGLGSTAAVLSRCQAGGCADVADMRSGRDQPSANCWQGRPGGRQERGCKAARPAALCCLLPLACDRIDPVPTPGAMEG